ncbi:MAG TPA: hypothetical protein VG889_08255 [Rhizomicrobium sp.]|nr:hypothetical protein [Rhizomicrobium sp.]
MSADRFSRSILFAGLCISGSIFGQGASTAAGVVHGPYVHPVKREPVPCHPDTELPNGLMIRSDGSIYNSDPQNLEILSDQVTTTTEDVGTDFPALLEGDDSAIASDPCDSTVDIEPDIPAMRAPQVPPTPSFPPPVIPPTPQPPLPIVTLGVGGCLIDPATPCKAPALDCRLPFCGRDIIFVHGLVYESLIDVIKARLGLHGDPRSLATWPQDAADFTTPGGYYREQAFGRWDHFIRNKLAPTYAAAGAAHGPRFLIVAWAGHQRMSVAAHAILSQITDTIRTDAHVMTVTLTGHRRIVDASQMAWWKPHTFCERGCVLVSSSNGGPLVAGAVALAATPQSTSWWTPSLGLLPRFFKGHVAFHPALSGSSIADVAVGVGLLGGPSCALGIDFLNNLSGSGGRIIGANVPPCQAMNEIVHSSIVDLMPATLALLWRPLISNAPFDIFNEVPSVIVAGAHPTSLPLIHFVRSLEPGFGDGIVSVDGQMGRPWAPGLWPLPEVLPDWGILGVKYYDRGSSVDKAVPYFVDQSLELGHIPGLHAGSVNPYLSPTGMILSHASFGTIPPTSSGLRNFHSFLQSTSTHFFPRTVGSGVASPPAGPLCPPDSYNYLPTGTNLAGISNILGLDSPVLEESRAVFEPDVYTTMGRNFFTVAEAGSGGTLPSIPVLSPRLKGDIDLQTKGRPIVINFKLLHIHKTVWIWKRQYLRMLNWRCRDEIDYALDYAFRK